MGGSNRRSPLSTEGSLPVSGRRWTPLLLLAGILTACDPADEVPDPGAPPTRSTPQAEVPGESDRAAMPGLHGAVAEDSAGLRRVWAWRDGDQVSTELRVAERAADDGAFGPPRTLIRSANPDRPALSPDGGTVAFVWGRTGLASVWVIPFDAPPPVSGKDPSPGGARQLTNVGLTSGRGRPDGFVPPPADTIRFDGDWLRWTSPEGDHSVRWR